MRIHVMGSDQRIVRCARVSYNKDDVVDIDRDIRLIKYLYENKHSSPFEHVVIAFESDIETWLSLMQITLLPTVQIYYTNNYIFLNLRQYANIKEFLPPQITSSLFEKLPATMSILHEQTPYNYTLDTNLIMQRKDTSSGYVILIDKLELGTMLDYYTFVVECPLFVARQWFRHRFGSFNEVSRRYVDYEPEFYIPPYFRKQAENNKQASKDEPVEMSDFYLDHVPIFLNEARHLYQSMIDDGVAKELARGVLPQFMKTRFYWTVPRISLDNFISLRKSSNAQKEIQEFALAIEELVGYKKTDRYIRL